MELKFFKVHPDVLNPICFNRTFMELKLDSSISCVTLALCFNRTFMELKLTLQAQPSRTGFVLIVPLWN